MQPNITKTAAKFKVETGLQLLTRLIKKPNIENIYPILFHTGPKHGEVIEIFSQNSSNHLLTDIITDTLILNQVRDTDVGVLILNTDGNFCYEILVKQLKEKLLKTVSLNSNNKLDSLNTVLHEMLHKLFILEVYDAIEFYTTIYNLERILTENPNISLVIFNTLTAFYWSEQGLKITKMDLYIKNLLKTIQKVTKDYRITTLYTRPEYFSSSKESIENLEPCCELPTAERVNYRIQLQYIDNQTCEVIVRTFNTQIKKMFNICDDHLKWL